MRAQCSPVLLLPDSQPGISLQEWEIFLVPWSVAAFWGDRGVLGLPLPAELAANPQLGWEKLDVNGAFAEGML